jgi:hypothetical protein
MTDDPPATPADGKLLPDLPDSEREQLQSAVSELFSRQAILRDLHGDRDLYDWTRSRFPWVRELCALIGFSVVLNEDDQLIYALPGDRVTLRRLRVEWTLVLLSLWYDYDVHLRAEGSPVIFSVEAFNDSLRDKIGERRPSLSSLRDILAFFASRKLVRMEYEEHFHKSRIEVLSTIRFVLPFGEMQKVAAALDELMAVNQQEGESNRG